MSTFEYLMPCIWFNRDDSSPKNTYFSALAGLLFFGGWWLFIDAAVVHSDQFQTNYYLWGVFGTISLLIVNSISNEMIDSDGNAFYSSSGGCLSSRSATVTMFFGLICGFIAIIASFWIMIEDFGSSSSSTVNPKPSSYPGICIFIQNTLIFFASIVFKFGRSEEAIF